MKFIRRHIRSHTAGMMINIKHFILMRHDIIISISLSLIITCLLINNMMMIKEMENYYIENFEMEKIVKFIIFNF